jgi:hypothetical protein
LNSLGTLPDICGANATVARVAYLPRYELVDPGVNVTCSSCEVHLLSPEVTPSPVIKHRGASKKCPWYTIEQNNYAQMKATGWLSSFLYDTVHKSFGRRIMRTSEDRASLNEIRAELAVLREQAEGFCQKAQRLIDEKRELFQAIESLTRGRQSNPLSRS